MLVLENKTTNTEEGIHFVAVHASFNTMSANESRQKPCIYVKLSEL